MVQMRGGREISAPIPRPATLDAPQRRWAVAHQQNHTELPCQSDFGGSPTRRARSPTIEEASIRLLDCQQNVNLPPGLLIQENTMKTRSVWSAALFSAALIGSLPSASARTYVEVEVAPPPARVEVVLAARRGYDWG